MWEQERVIDPRLEKVEEAARRGALSASLHRQVVRDAVDDTLYRWALKIAGNRQEQVADLERWAFRVAANAAKAIATRRSASDTPFDATALNATEKIPPEQTDHEPALVALELRDALANRLTGKQLLVTAKLTEPGMSLHRAAKELGMDRSNLRRCFRRALRVLSQR